MESVCSHLGPGVDPAPAPVTPDGCTDCLRIGSGWVNLRICLTCGNVGCCNSSPNRHATGHHQATGHPLVRSFQPGQDWWWCYPDEVMFTVPGTPPAPSFGST